MARGPAALVRARYSRDQPLATHAARLAVTDEHTARVELLLHAARPLVRDSAGASRRGRAAALALPGAIRMGCPRNGSPGIFLAIYLAPSSQVGAPPHAAPRASLPQSKTHAKTQSKTHALRNSKTKGQAELSGAALLAHFYTAELAANVTRIFARDLLAFGYPPWNGVSSASSMPVTPDSIRRWAQERFRPAFVHGQQQIGRASCRERV